MQNGGQTQEDGQIESVSSPAPELEEWANLGDDDIMLQHSNVQSEEANKIPFVGDKEPLNSLAAEYELVSPILLEKIKVLDEQYSAIRHTMGDGNCFFRSFMFSYLEHILERQDQAEVERIKVNVEECRKTLQKLGYADLTFEDFFAVTYINFITCSLPVGVNVNHHDTDGGVNVNHHVTCSCDTGGVNVNHHDFLPVARDRTHASCKCETNDPFITLLYRPGHYDILYPK